MVERAKLRAANTPAAITCSDDEERINGSAVDLTAIRTANTD